MAASQLPSRECWQFLSYWALVTGHTLLDVYYTPACQQCMMLPIAVAEQTDAFSNTDLLQGIESLGVATMGRSTGNVRRML